MQPGPNAFYLRRGPFVLAITVSALLVLSAPFVGQIRSAIRAQFPGRFVLIVGAIIAAGLGIALAWAFFRIRDRRAARYAAIASAVAIAVIYSTVTANPNPEANVVERFHFLQYGLITFLFYRAWRPLGDAAILLFPMLAGLIVGTAEEWWQWFIPNRVGEMKDVLLNLVAIGTGLLFSLGVDPPSTFTAGLSRGSRPRAARLAAAALLIFAAFFHVVHLGYWIDDHEAGRFASRYSRTALLALQEERNATWKLHPPPTVLVRLSREDQYLTEGLQHVRERNRLWSAGDIRGAWLENRVLETYYAPVLDTPTHEGRSGHRWPAAQRADAQHRLGAAVTAADYVSDAYPYPLFAWSKWMFWLVVAIACGAVTGMGRA